MTLKTIRALPAFSLLTAMLLNMALVDTGLAADLSTANVTAPVMRDLQSALQQRRDENNQKNKSSGIHQKLGQHLAALLVKHKTSGVTARSNAFVRVRAPQMVQTYISLQHTAAQDLAELRNIGVELQIVNSKLRKIQAWVAIDQLETLTEMTNIESITSPRYAQPRTGLVNSEGDTILRADQLRSLGFRGEGVKVGIISDGANDWLDAKSTGDLPTSLTRYGSCSKRAEDPPNCVRKLSCNEGTAMAEIIHDLAPDAQLAVAAVSTSLEFIQSIELLANNFGADIIVDDLGFYAEPYFEDGEVADAVAALPGRVLYISSAGNGGTVHYEQDFKPYTISSFTRHDFGNDDEKMAFAVPARGFVVAVMQWNDQFDAPASDYDLTIVSQTLIVGLSRADQSLPGVEPLEAVCAYNPAATEVINFAIVDQVAGADRRLEMFFLGAPEIEYGGPSGSIFGHAAVPRTLAIGSINAGEPGNDLIASYSAWGPARIDFPSNEIRNKPDLAGIDGVSVTGTGGFRSPFFGTSAAAPHVAGVAAQLMSVSDKVTAKNVKDALTRGAVDLGTSGPDETYGFGLVDAINAKNLLQQGTVLPPWLILLDE